MNIKSLFASENGIDFNKSINTRISKPCVLLFMLTSGLSSLVHKYTHAYAYASACTTSEDLGANKSSELLITS